MNKSKNILLMVTSLVSVIALFGLFFGVVTQSVNANTRQTTNASLTIGPNNAGQANPGEPVVYTHTLTNTGDTADVITITVSSTLGFQAQVEPETVSLESDESTLIMVTVVVAEETSANTEGVTTVTAVSGNDNTVVVSATNTTTVNAVYGVAISPGNSGDADPGEMLSYSHTVTNTGNITDTIVFAVDSSAEFATQIPSSVLLGQGESSIVTVMITVPIQALADTVDVLTVTAVSDSDDGVTDTAVNMTTVNLVPGLLVTPEAQSQNADPDSQVHYPYVVSNTGNATNTYNLTANSDQGYDVDLNVSQLALPAFTSDTVTVTITIPPDAEAGASDVTVLIVQSDDNPDLTRTVTSTTHINLLSGVRIVPDNEGFAYPGETAVYRHTVTNTSNRREIISLTASSNQGWVVDVEPPILDLARNASGVVTVSVSVPIAELEGTEDITTVTATNEANQSDTAENITVIRYHHLFLPVVTRPASWEKVGEQWPDGVTARALAVCPSDRNTIVAGTIDNGILLYNGTTWVPASSVPLGFSVTGVVMNETCDRVYASLFDNGVWQGERNGPTWTWTQVGGDAVKLARTLAMAGDTLFVGGDFGIRYWQNNSWQNASGINAGQPVMYISAAEPYTYSTPLYAVQWQNSEIYRGLSTSPGLWGSLPLPDLPDNLTRVVFGSPQNVRFVGTNEKSYQLVNDNWQLIDVSAGLRSAVIKGEVAYLGYNLNAGVYKLQGNNLTPIDAGWSIKPQFVYGLALAEGQLYAATTTGVWVYQQP